MRKNVLKKKKEISLTAKNLIGILLSAIIGTVITIILTFILSYILANSETISDSVAALFIAVILIGGFLCGIISSRLTAFKGIVSGIISSVAYLLFITVNMLFFADGKLSPNTLFLYIGILITAAIGGVCGANMKRRK